MNKHLSPGMVSSDELRLVAMTPDRIAEIQLACEAVATYAERYRIVPHHPAVAEYRTARFTQFLEAYHALKGLVDD